MESLAKSLGKETINWKKELSGEISKERLIELKDLSTSWITCPCGQSSILIPRGGDNNDEPVDEVLHKLGVRFNNLLENDDIKGALHLCNMINIHGKFLLEEEERKATETFKTFFKTLGKKLPTLV